MKPTQNKRIEEKVFSFMEEHQMLRPDEKVVAGISGGADSVCLLFVLLAWKKKYGLELTAVHVDHGIRQDAAYDARFVEELCRKQGVPFYLRKTNVRELAVTEKCSEEEAGRNFRYRTFAQVAEEVGADKIAVAHNLNDRSETVLFHLFRGSGVKGLAGILPVRDRIIRPLLCLERTEIEDYLLNIDQDYCNDSTNEEDDYTRNRIRHHILPYAEQEIIPGCVQHIGQTAQIMEETEDYLARQTREALEQCKLSGEYKNSMDDTENPEKQRYVLDPVKFACFHPVLQKRMLLTLLKELSPKARDVSYVHVTDLLELMTREGNRRICLPFGIQARREYEKVLLEHMPKTDEEEEPFEGIRVDLSVLLAWDLPRNEEKELIFPQNQYTKWFDYDKIKKPPVLRTRREGDYLTISDGCGNIRHKSLQDYMVTEKIPPGERKKIPVLAEDSHIIWLVGYRISEFYKVREDTKRILQVQFITACESGETEDKYVGKD